MNRLEHPKERQLKCCLSFTSYHFSNLSPGCSSDDGGFLPCTHNLPPRAPLPQPEVLFPFRGLRWPSALKRKGSRNRQRSLTGTSFSLFCSTPMVAFCCYECQTGEALLWWYDIDHELTSLHSTFSNIKKEMQFLLDFYQL